MGIFLKIRAKRFPGSVQLQLPCELIACNSHPVLGFQSVISHLGQEMPVLSAGLQRTDF